MKTNYIKNELIFICNSNISTLMKKGLKVIIQILLLTSLIYLSSCVTDTIDTFDTITIQVPIQVDLTQRGNSDTTIQLEYLNDYPEYRNNKERIKNIKLYQAAFWIEELDPIELNERFISLDYYFEIGGQRYHIASYNNFTIRDFYKIPHIDQIPDSVAQEISDRIIKDEYFTTYLIIQREAGSTIYFNSIKSKVVIDVRIKVSL